MDGRAKEFGNVDITVVVATFNRASQLAETLRSIEAVDSGDLVVQLVVVDNGSSDETAQVLDQFVSRFDCICVSERRSGKNVALNTALGHVAGELVVFTDDDVVVPGDWLLNYWSGVSLFPCAHFFGGPVTARLPESAPSWLRSNLVDLGQLNLGVDSRLIASHEFFVGTNFAVRRAVFDRGLRFDEAIGPSRRTVMKGNETSFQVCMRQHGFVGAYLAECPVLHCVDGQPAMLQRATHLRRKFQMARGLVYLGLSDPGRYSIGRRLPLAPFYNLLVWLIRWLCFLASGSEVRRFECELWLAFEMGKIIEFWKKASHTRSPVGPSMGG